MAAEMVPLLLRLAWRAHRWRAERRIPIAVLEPIGGNGV
jgi:hypothetical protein